MIKWIRKYLDDPKLDIQERSFVLLSIVGLIGILLAVVNGLVLDQPVMATIFTAVGFVVFSLLMAYGLKRGKIQLTMAIITACLVFVFLPGIFFTSGGIYSGSPVWFTFATLYIVMILDGKRRVFFLSAEALMIVVCWYIGYRNPEWITEFTMEDAYLDSIAALFTVGAVMVVLVSFQTRLYRQESERAEKKAQEVEELNRAQNRFFSSMSHEIRTPINSILGLNELILRQEDASDEIIRDAGNIQGAGKMLLALINDILDFSKIEAGSMDIVPVEYRVGDMISEIVNMIWLRASEKGLKFSVDIDPQVPAVLFGDEVRLKQILVNLLNNAVKYTPSGSIGLHIESEDAGENRVLLKISVSDTGMGIKKEAIPYLFDAFKRVDQEKNRRIEGTGLGLSIVKQLVELMGGTVTVNSIYTQGSTFTVSLRQGVADARAIGDLNITNTDSGFSRRRRERRFSAPEARILIVDDNEMNLEVECKLLSDTDIMIDTAASGAKALEKTLITRYDLIFMDHLMPEMDGVECLEKIRSQTGGLNKNIPVVVLTANAGGENRELYNAACFDGYLVKPVSGNQLEDMLLKHLPEEKVLRTGSSSMTGGELSTSKDYIRKQSVAVTTGSMSDLPDTLIKQLGLNVIPWSIHTKDGVFSDGVEMSADELVRYINAGNNDAYSEPAETAEYAEFFGAVLKTAHHVIHIALTTGMSKEYERAVEAARSFENVTVVESGCLSSAAGLLTLVAYKLSQQNMSVEEIVEELEAVKRRIHCSFIIRTTDYMARRGLISKRVHSIATALELRPCLKIKNNKSGIGGIWLGNVRRCYDRYIGKALKASQNPDTDILFVTYVDVSEEDLGWIEDRIRARASFEHIIFQQASAAISSNCGPGTFGLLFMDKGKNYNLGSLIPAEREAAEHAEQGEETTTFDAPAEPAEQRAPEKESAAPEGGEAQLADALGLDYAAAVRSCGGAESFRKVLELFCRSARAKADEIEGFWRAGDLTNYTVKVHALKSSARLVGALELGEQARELEAAGKAADMAAIEENTPRLLARCRGYAEEFDALSGGAGDDALPPIGKDALAEAYASLAECAGLMDYDMAEMVLDSLKRYRLPPEDADRVEQLRAALVDLDWDRVAALGKG
ncbi:MAG: DegV family EDD domain-containing protein [Ruminococcaceae bacterium]|nr:DegV family EDD domain-containing protein [Oscillospiraceae bacterium]